MNHVAILEAADRIAINGKDVQQRAAGRFYTHRVIAARLAATIGPLVGPRQHLTVADPFGGDGRLVCRLLKEFVGVGVDHIEATISEQEAAAASVASNASPPRPAPRARRGGI